MTAPAFARCWSGPRSRSARISRPSCALPGDPRKARRGGPRRCRASSGPDPGRAGAAGHHPGHATLRLDVLGSGLTATGLPRHRALIDFLQPGRERWLGPAIPRDRPSASPAAPPDAFTAAKYPEPAQRGPHRYCPPATATLRPRLQARLLATPGIAEWRTLLLHMLMRRSACAFAIGNLVAGGG